MCLWFARLHRLLVMLMFLLVTDAQAQSRERAIWMWEEDSWAMLKSPEQARDKISFLKRQDIDTIYLYADAYADENLLVNQPQLYAQLIDLLHREGLKVHALLGSWHLHTERYILPENRGKALKMVQRVLDYNQQAPSSARFDGINLDIEPHVLDDWSSRRVQYLQMFLSVSEAWMALKRRMNQTLKIGPAIAFWLDGIIVTHAGQTKPASEHLQDIYDHVVLMDYRDHAHGPDGILSHAMDELAYGRRIGKPVWLGIETSPNEIRKISFDHLSPKQMENELSLVRQALINEQAFAGFVIHHYGSYRSWLAR
jgi:hypothetical protein